MLPGLEDGKVTKQALKTGTKNIRMIKAKLSEPQYAGTTSEGGSKAAEALMAADPTLDALIPAGGGGDPLQGAIAAVERAGKDSGYRHRFYRLPSRPWRKT